MLLDSDSVSETSPVNVDGDNLHTSSSPTDHTGQLSWKPLVLTREKIASLWEKFKQFPVMFDDLTKGDYNLYINALMSPNSLFYEIGDEVGIAAATNINLRVDAVVHLIMFDRRLRGREEVILEILDDVFTRGRLARVTAAFPANRTTTRKLVERLGFAHEGTLRNGMLIDGLYEDVIIYGLLREEMYGGQ